MFVAGGEEADAIDAVLGRIEQAAGWRPAASSAFGARDLEDAPAIGARFGGLLRRNRRARVERIGRQRRKHRYDGSDHLRAQVHRHGGHRKHEQQQPDPNPAGAVQVEQQRVAALGPAERKRLAPRTRARKREAQGDEGIEHPDDRDDAHEQRADVVAADERNLEAVVQLVEERQHVLAGERHAAPITPALFDAADGVDGDLVPVDRMQLAGRRVDAWRDPDLHRLIGLGDKRQVSDAHVRVRALDRIGEFERRPLRTWRACHVECGIEPAIEFVVPRDHRARQAGDEEEGGDEKPEPAVDQAE